MKASVCIVILSLLASVSAFPQGTVNFANNSDTRVCLDPDGFVPVGSAFNAELMYAPDGTPSDAFDAVAVRLGNSIGFGPSPGFFSGGVRTAPTATPGGFGLFQVRAWETRYGTDYRTVIAMGMGRVGKSDILRVDTGNPATTPPGTPVPLTQYGLTSFMVGWPESPPCIIPEPSILGLALLGAGVLWVWRRRN